METPVRAKLGLAAAAAAGAIAAYVYYRYRSRLKTDGNMVLRSAYAPAPYLIETVDLNFILTEEQALVKSTLRFVCSGAACPLYLDGEDLALRSIALNGVPLVEGHDYVLGAEEGLTVLAPPASAFELSIVVAIKPQENTQLSGLYKTSGNYCTQCEAVGFRRITYFLDRPDILSKYTVRVEADKALYPVLLSNGNETGRGEMAGSRHWASFEDPFKKPCYLFALVAAKLEGIESSFTTCSGKQVRLAIWSEAENAGQLDWAMQSLKDAMAWDERVYGREYDLDVFHIVAVNDFNMGAMENKGLNVFNTACVLAKSSTATDADYERVQGVVAHEYFHNWTGNRVTCRDWFQLTLKEGLTVFRDQSFSADMTSEAVKRIEDVRVMRAHQFVEDAGPMAHPIRPESYLAIDNFYTVTVYEKGAEVIRLYQTLLGAAGFRKGMDLYFERHDGQAVTCDDFRAAMADANGRDLTQFERWYTQAGTPVVSASGSYDSDARCFSLTLRQHTPATPGQPIKEPFHIPVTVGLILEDGSSHAPSQVLQLVEAEQTFTFKDVPSKPVPSLLRGFSAPVRLQIERSFEELAFLAANDDDPFNRWDASQQLATRVLLDLSAELSSGSEETETELQLPDGFVQAFRATVTAEDVDPSLRAYSLTLPDYSTLSQEMKTVDPDALCGALRFTRRQLAEQLGDELSALYQKLTPIEGEPFNIEPESVGKRRLRNVCLGYLSKLSDEASQARCVEQFRKATCMTDSLAAASALASLPGCARNEVLSTFYERAKENKEALVINKWFAMQAAADAPDALESVKALMLHEAFDSSNPNRLRSLVQTFASANPSAFHAADGSGYSFIADQVLDIDSKNPQVAARLCGAFGQWRRYTADRKRLMEEQLVRIKQSDGLSKDTFEIASRSLA
mmetsp:Transcript_8665/g.14574  ORF Transcript_8665/g.14574 Transcript_8665/m.14574 type:complete len:909 (-) Transcript_8665:403-3129(-)